jgi:hypothetical protein
MTELSRKENYLCVLRREETEFMLCDWGMDVISFLKGGVCFSYDDSKVVEQSKEFGK